MKKYIGLDMDCKKTVACVLINGEKDITILPPDVGSLADFLIKHKSRNCKVYAAFEVSGQAGFIYDSLAGYVDELKVVNPTKTTWIYRTNKKNDRIDAEKIAILYSIDQLPSVYMPAKPVRQWRQMILHRQNTVQKIVKVKNQVRALVKSDGYLTPEHKGSWWSKSNRKWMESLCDIEEDVLWSMQLEDLLEQLTLLESQRDKITERLDKKLKGNSGAELLMSIPGVGPRTAEAMLAYTDDINRFSNYKQYSAYFGLTPKLDESGSTRRLGHISKHGPQVVRWVLCESSWRVIRFCPAIRKFYERVMGGQPGRKKIAIVAVARKLTSIMRAMLKSGEMFNAEMINQAA